MVIKKSGDREEYDRGKIEKSFHIACKKRPVSEKIIQEAIQIVEEKISNISNNVMITVIFTSLAHLAKRTFRYLTEDFHQK